VITRTLLATSATLLTFGATTMLPAEAGTLTLGISGSGLANIGINPLLAGQTFGNYTVPSQIDISVENVTASATVLDDPAQYLDGSITLDSSLASAWLDNSSKAVITSYLAGIGLTPDQALQTADDIFDITNFTGSGLLSSSTASTDFNVIYDNTTNSLSVTDYNPNVIDDCTVGPCELSASLSFGVSLAISEFLEFSTGLVNNPAITLDDDVLIAIEQVNQLLSSFQAITGVDGLELATVSASLNLSTTVLGSDASGTAADVSFITTGGTLTGVNSDTQDTLFATALADDVSGNDPLAGDPPGTDSTSQSVPEPGLLLGLLGIGTVMVKSMARTQKTHTV